MLLLSPSFLSSSVPVSSTFYGMPRALLWRLERSLTCPTVRDVSCDSSSAGGSTAANLYLSQFFLVLFGLANQRHSAALEPPDRLSAVRGGS